ncbi:major facilitator superfamily transporter [Colletotrichum karsti]|uniref:Major facilitator superfamily transporter n=1 Tax=Colletotrichum karsti TaxID=1095194 RepID=A0A9P6LN27_9PEZI|nr:major facilitator superfamily transporter [Colletotrichum karsti]KAF9878117.1 major facilitator superfamily transporter [Colletotrichum karsti]
MSTPPGNACNVAAMLSPTGSGQNFDNDYSHIPGKNKSSSEKINISEGQVVDEPPDGGYGWVCTSAAAVINGHSWGFNSAYAVFLAYYLDHDTFPNASPLKYAFVGSLSLAFLLLTSPIATLSVTKYGIRPTMLCGVVFETASLLLASLASEIWHLFLTQGVLFGIGLGLLFIPTAAVVPQWFTTKRSLASGISLSGAGLGGAVYSLAASAMIRNLGLQWAFRILGVLAFCVNTSCTILIRDRKKATTSKQSVFEISLFKRKEYLLLIGFSAFTMLGYFILIFSLANFAMEIGLRPSEAAIISALFNFGQAIGRPLIGYFSDGFGRMNMAALMTFIAGVLSLVVWVNARTYGVLIFYAISEGLVAGNFWATIAPLMAEVLGLNQVPSGLNLMWLSMVLPSTFSEPIALQIVSGTGSYLGAQLFTGFMYITAAFCMTLLRGWKVRFEEPDSPATVESRNGDEEKSPRADSGNLHDKPLVKVQLLAVLLACLRWKKV